LEIAARYVPGVVGLDVGGDWYSAVSIDETRVGFVVGDVAGNGLRAATVMAGLRYTIRTLVLEGYEPGAILETSDRILDTVDFATVVCGVIDLERLELSIASAGHPPVLLINDGGAEFLAPRPGPPIGASPEPSYLTVTVPIQPRGTLIGYTDGLIERRGETLQQGFDRLRSAAVTSHAESLDDLVDDLLERVSPPSAVDDTVVIGLRWSVPEGKKNESSELG
jgi:serine phosphatase RsbU (regulator of sigma subunit)